MTYAKLSAIDGAKESPWHPLGDGIMASPGKYTATLYKRQGGVVEQLSSAQSFEVKSIFGDSPSHAKAFEFSQSLVAADRRSSSIGKTVNHMKN